MRRDFKIFSPILNFIKRHLNRKLGIFGVLFAGFTLFFIFFNQQINSQKLELIAQLTAAKTQLEQIKQEMASQSAELEALKSEDQYKINQDLQNKIAEVEKTYGRLEDVIEEVADAKAQGVATGIMEKDLAAAIADLGNLKYEAAREKLATISSTVKQQLAIKLAPVVESAVPNQNPPAAGSYSRQSVTTSRGTFTVSLIAEEASSVRMITDAAADNTCSNDCPVLPLATYVVRNGGFAGINGSYFCPPDYPSCAGKVNSFDTLFFNARTKNYLNSDNNIYSNNPMVVQNADRSIRFMGRALEWGRDTGINGGISNFPMLVSGGNAVNFDTGVKGLRGFIGVKGGTLYIGVVHGADYGDAAAVLDTLGLDYAMNLDGGGSSALYYNGSYKVGPGRNIPNAIILAR